MRSWPDASLNTCRWCSPRSRQRRAVFGDHLWARIDHHQAGDQGDQGMTQRTILLDPTSERSPALRARLPRPKSLQGKTFGLLDIGKRRGDLFLDRIEELLRQRGFEVNRYRKARFSIVAPRELKQRIREECNIAIEALAD